MFALASAPTIPALKTNTNAHLNTIPMQYTRKGYDGKALGTPNLSKRE
jgi:hypothetical protein